MGVRDIHLLGSPVLRETAREVSTVDDAIRDLVRDLLDTMRADSGIGLAANQVGIAQRVAVVQTEEEEEPAILIDPVIMEREGQIRGEEGCLSIPDIFAEVTRARRILVETTTLDNTRMRIEADELRARAIQHEIDHLDGVLFIDHLSPLKRRMLLAKWRKSRWAKLGQVKEITSHAGATPRF